MVLITCNAIGDILAVAQLIRDIARALDDARGAAAEYQRLVLQLSIVGTVMEEAHRIADASREDALKTALLAAVRLCHIDIVNASKLLPGYENLSRPTTIGGWTLSRARTSAKKLKWHLLKASDAAILADRLQTSQLRMNSIVVCMNRSSILRNLGQLAGAVGGLSAVSEQDHIRTREEIARSRYHLSKELQDLSASSNIQNANLKQSLHDSTRAINDALQELQTHSRHSASALHQDIVKMALKFSATSSARDRASVERVSDAVINRLNPEGSTLELERQRFLSSLVPFAIVGVTFVAHANIDPRWQTTALWATVCALIMHVLRLQSSPPPSVWRVSENVIILIDALGDRMPIALQLCTSLEHFHSFIENYYTTHERPGQHLVQRGYYELYKAENSEIITSVSWSQHITPGAKIEMGILLRRAGLGLSATIVCPWCKKETYGDGSSTLLSCMGCGRSFDATKETSNSDYRPSDPARSNEGHAPVIPPLHAHQPDDKTSAPNSNPLAAVDPDAGGEDDLGERELEVAHEIVRIRVILQITPPPLHTGPQPVDQSQPDLLTLGFLAMSFGSNNAFMLLNHFIGVPDCRVIGIQCYQDKSYRYTGSNGQPSRSLDYQNDQKGTVIRQEMWSPMQPGDVHRHFDNARSMQWPIFFFNNILVPGVGPGAIVGIDLSLVGHANLQQTMVQPYMAAPLGGLTTTHLCLKWPGYREYKKQVEIQDAHRQPIRMLKLVERTARFVERWINEAQRQPIDPRLAHWRVGPGAITKDHLYIVGLVHVSPGTWQPILQLKNLNFH